MRSVMLLPARAAVAIAQWWLDDAIPADRLHRWMVSTADRLVRADVRGRLDSGILADVQRADAVLRSREGITWWPAISIESERLSESSPREEINAATAWLRSLSDGQAIRRGVTALDTGRRLDQLAAAADPQAAAVVDDNAERLLRHIETRRRESLSELCDPQRNPLPLDRHARSMQRHDIAIFFCRHARRKQDIRFLNAALKLNDWAFAAHRRFRASEHSARYLLALAEQETTLHDWSLQCELPYWRRLPTVSTHAS